MATAAGNLKVLMDEQTRKSLEPLQETLESIASIKDIPKKISASINQLSDDIDDVKNELGSKIDKLQKTVDCISCADAEEMLVNLTATIVNAGSGWLK